MRPAAIGREYVSRLGTLHGFTAMNVLFFDASTGQSCFIAYPPHPWSIFHQNVINFRDSVINPSSLILMTAFVHPFLLYHTYPLWLVVIIIIIIIIIIIML